MRLKAIICEVLAREAYFCAAHSPHVLDLELLDKGLHEVSADLRAELQSRLDVVDPTRYEGILLGYGLCGTSVAGLRATSLPVIVPRAHDCITLYLGSQERYQDYFVNKPGTYYYTPDYMERGGSKSLVALGTGSEADVRSEYERYVAKYGKDNADYLMEVMGGWKKHYNRATYIDVVGVPLPDYRREVKDEAERRGWTYEETTGQLSLLMALFCGDWDEARFLRVAPGQQIVATYDGHILGAE